MSRFLKTSRRFVFVTIPDMFCVCQERGRDTICVRVVVRGVTRLVALEPYMKSIVF